MELTFWGSRGSIPVFSRGKVQFGTNTSCVEVKLPGRERIIFDAGTGIILLGDHLSRSGNLERETLHLFLSHFHWDHVNGLPFFKPAYREGAKIEIYGRPGVQNVFTAQLATPYSPISPEALSARIRFVVPTTAVQIADAAVTSFQINHPQGCNGYVVQAGGKKVVYATDSEPDGGEMDRTLVENASGADILIMDSTNRLDEAAERRGWGHSTWQDCVRVATEAKVGKIVLFHHDAFHNDEDVRAKETLARQLLPATICAYDGLTVQV